ncbi:MAG: M48 family metallopeptidase [Acidobacteriota bacterium]
MIEPIQAETIRCRNDRELFDRLSQDPTVKEVNEALEKQQEEGHLGIRRRLLATSVRLSRRMAEPIHRIADACSEALGLDLPLELYVYPSSRYNAACFKPEEGRLFVMFSSALLDRFREGEIRFVLGHELGHHVFRHLEIPIGYILRGQQPPPPKLALELFAWSRYAEISADRAGAYCAQDFDSVARALFKLASGLSGHIVEFRLEDFLAQVDDMQIEDGEPGQGAPQEDWFSTHPFSPLRVKALQLFYRSELVGREELTLDELEDAVENLMGLMEPSYIEGRTHAAEVMRRVLFAGAVAVAQADGKISPEEIEIFDKFLGKGAFSSQIDVENLIAELPERLQQARDSTTTPQRIQVLRDICLVARADGKVGKKERRVLDQIADGLNVSRTFISHCIESDLDPF